LHKKNKSSDYIINNKNNSFAYACCLGLKAYGIGYARGLGSKPMGLVTPGFGYESLLVYGLLHICRLNFDTFVDFFIRGAAPLPIDG
jgi:hypothetical protein